MGVDQKNNAAFKATIINDTMIRRMKIQHAKKIQHVHRMNNLERIQITAEEKKIEKVSG